MCFRKQKIEKHNLNFLHTTFVNPKLFHRLILRQIRKLWDHGGAGNNSSSSAEGRTYTRRGGVNTVSGNFADLPTYRQVLQTIQKEEMPPSYYDVSKTTAIYESYGIVGFFIAAR